LTRITRELAEIDETLRQQEGNLSILRLQKESLEENDSRKANWKSR